ncbi:MAG: Hsp20/alpha crystallin family protein [Acidobacteriia bacterium]|nr:Hsp20/alpha crystallin family protein [Terriglobia bacterium]
MLRPQSSAFLSPFSLLRDMTDWMDQVFEGSDMPITRGERVWAPAIEVRERDNNIVVCADLPGIDPKDVKVEVENNTLVIEGERKREQTEEREGFRRSERFYGNFFRAIPLPENVKADQAKADVRNGVLEVTIPVDQAHAHRKQIPIGNGPSQQQAQSTRSTAQK